MKITTFILYLIVMIIPCVTPLSFNYPQFGTQENGIKLEGDAYFTPQGIKLTQDELGANRNDSTGRAFYSSPLHLWDRSSGELANFNTNFTFLIDSNGNWSYADGLTFFLAKNTSFFKAGGSLGLPINDTIRDPNDQFVAVEFDTFWNTKWDPLNLKISEGDHPGDSHVGINVNSLISVEAVKWPVDITKGNTSKAWIDYNSDTTNLSVLFTTGNLLPNGLEEIQGIHYIVDLREFLPELVIFGFSASTGFNFEKNNIKSWAFDSSDLKSEPSPLVPTPSPNPEPTDPDILVAMPKGGKGENRTGVLVAVVVGVLIVGLASLFGIILLIKKRRRVKQEAHEELGADGSMDDEFKKSGGPQRFSYEELARATNDFAEDEKLGEGGFGGVYRGFLKESSSFVAVKRVSSTSKQGLKEYASEVKIISLLRHRNLVQLIGWCHEKKELLLVYEFMENGSLDSHLFKEKSLLTWGVRYKVAQGLASALLYLHEGWEQCVLHRDIKSSNIMLDSNFNAKLGDFGLAKLVDHEKGTQTTLVAGTMGYMSPESFITGKASKGSDVYSFGIVALEIASGQKPIDSWAKDGKIKLVDRIWEHYGGGKLLEAADPRLCGNFDEEQVERLMIVGLWCAHPNHNFRPSMKQAIQVLNFEAQLPSLPPTVPVLAYLPSTVNMLAFSGSSSSGITGSEGGQTRTSGSSYYTNSSVTSKSPSTSSSSALLHGQ